MKILIVDDQESVHVFFKNMVDFKALGITEQIYATNGKTALDIIHRSHPEIMLLDIEMPIMSGIDLLNALDTEEFCPKIIILSAYNEFEYARKCLSHGVVDYLLKPIDISELEDKMSLLVRDIHNEKVNNLAQVIEACIVNEQYNANSELPCLFKNMDIHKYGFVCTRHADSITDTAIMHASLHHVITVSNPSFMILLFTCPSLENWTSFYDDLKLNADDTVGLSHYRENAEEAPDALNESIEALNQGFYKASVYLYDQNAFSEPKYDSWMECNASLKQACQNRDVQRIKLYAERLFYIFEQMKVYPRYVHDYCYNFLLNLNPNFFETFHHINGAAAVRSEFNYSDAASLKRSLIRMILTMINTIKPDEIKTDIDIVKQIKNYIDSNCNKNLSLDTISNQFFISKYQISRLFTKNYGINYCDYILKVRMEIAARLLKHSDSKIIEIAHQTGYDEISYFSNVFKRYYGCAPSKYRQHVKTN